MVSDFVKPNKSENTEIGLVPEKLVLKDYSFKLPYNNIKLLPIDQKGKYYLNKIPIEFKTKFDLIDITDSHKYMFYTRSRTWNNRRIYSSFVIFTIEKPGLQNYFLFEFGQSKPIYIDTFTEVNESNRIFRLLLNNNILLIYNLNYSLLSTVNKGSIFSRLYG